MKPTSPYSTPGKRTLYRGVVYGSTTEATWAATLVRAGLSFTHEPVLDLGIGYLPDFLVEGQAFLEVKPSTWRGYPTMPGEWHRKAEALRRSTGLPVLVVFGDASGARRQVLRYERSRPSQLDLLPSEVVAELLR